MLGKERKGMCLYTKLKFYNCVCPVQNISPRSAAIEYQENIPSAPDNPFAESPTQSRLPSRDPSTQGSMRLENQASVQFENQPSVQFESQPSARSSIQYERGPGLENQPSVQYETGPVQNGGVSVQFENTGSVADNPFLQPEQGYNNVSQGLSSGIPPSRLNSGVPPLGKD